jgi:SAM-dependent methyltransferase
LVAFAKHLFTFLEVSRVRKPPASPQAQDTIAAPHPLAKRLIERVRAGCVLDFACGKGRNSAALRRAGLCVVAIDDGAAESSAPLKAIDEIFVAALSTHGLLHGRVPHVAAKLRSIAERLAPNGLLYATFGSAGDARFGQGTRIDDWTYAPAEGDERGVAHAFFDRARLERLLEEHFTIETLEEHAVDEVAGSWAHQQTPLTGAIHWFAIARATAR